MRVKVREVSQVGSPLQNGAVAASVGWESRPVFATEPLANQNAPPRGVSCPDVGSGATRGHKSAGRGSLWLPAGALHGGRQASLPPPRKAPSRMLRIRRPATRKRAFGPTQKATKRPFGPRFSPFPIPLLCSRGADAPFCVPAKRGFRVLWKRRRCMASQTRAGARTVLARGCAVAAPLAASGGPPRQRLSWFARSAKSLGSVLQIMSDSVYREWGGNLRPGLRLPALTSSRFRGTDKFWSHPSFAHVRK